jgi:thioredoxin 1
LFDNSGTIEGVFEMANVQEVGLSNFAQEVEQEKGVVLVDFTATWCPPCKALAPVLESVAAKYAERVKVVKVDVDQNGPLAARFGVQGIPNLLFFQDGQVVNQAVGFQSEAQLSKILDGVLN